MFSAELKAGTSRYRLIMPPSTASLFSTQSLKQPHSGNSADSVNESSLEDSNALVRNCHTDRRKSLIKLLPICNYFPIWSALFNCLFVLLYLPLTLNGFCLFLIQAAAALTQPACRLRRNVFAAGAAVALKMAQSGQLKELSTAAAGRRLSATYRRPSLLPLRMDSLPRPLFNTYRNEALFDDIESGAAMDFRLRHCYSLFMWIF